MVEATDFASRVSLSITKDAENRRQNEVNRVAAAIIEYGQNRAVIDRYNIPTQFQTVANRHKEKYGREAKITISPEPFLDTDELNPKIPVMQESAGCSVKLEWEPVRTLGVKYGIEVSAANGRLTVISGGKFDNTHPSHYSFITDKIEPDALNQALLEAYQNPRKI